MELKFEIFKSCPGLDHGVYLRGYPYFAHQTEQIHSDRFYEIGELPLPPADALITKKKGEALLIRHADCQAAIIYDPKTEILAVVHAGWRGLVKGIYTRVIDHLKDAHRCAPEDLLIGISPSLGKEHAEFRDYKTLFPESFLPFRYKECHFDLKGAAKDELMRCGVLEGHIEISPICTFEDTRCYSYRRDKTSERHATVACLKPKGRVP